MQKFILSIVIYVTAILLFCQCSDRANGATDGYGKEYPRTRETFDIIDSAMNYMQTDPALSHHIIDSVCQAKLMSPQRCDYYHAMVLDTGEEKRDSALAICNRILDEGQFGDDKYLEEEVCELASNIAYSIGRYLETLEYVNRGTAICHGQEEMNYDEAMMLGRAGQAEQMLGRTDEAKETFAKATKLIEKDKSFGGLIARISLLMKQIALYFSTQEYDKSIAVCQQVLNLVENFHRDPSSVENRPKPMTTSGDATLRFADYYQSQMYVRLAKAYHNKIKYEGLPDTSAYLDSLNLYLDRWQQTQSHNTTFNLANVIRELYFTGRKAEFNEAKAAVASYYQGDSIVSEYVDYLHLLAEEASSRNDVQGCNGYLQRALAISDSIRQHDMLRKLSEQMSIHMVQQQQLARQKAESLASFYKLILFFFITIVASCIIIMGLRHKYKKTAKILQITQQDLIETKEEANGIKQQLQESKQEKAAKDMQELYNRIMQVVEKKKLYLNPGFSMSMLAEEMCTNRTSISTCINDNTGKQFRTWLAEFRLKLFLEKRRENPNVPIDHLLIQCGYNDRSTFQRQFKAIMGTTPSKYKGANIPEFPSDQSTETCEKVG